MKILGLNNDMFISSAALIEDGKIVAAACEERFYRKKRTRKFPISALQFCLEASGVKLEEVDIVAVHWNPGVYMIGFNPLLSAHRRFKGEYLYSVPDYLCRFYNNPHVSHIEQILQFSAFRGKIIYVTHHRAHSANGYYLSPFDKAAIFTADAQGELESTTYGRGEGNKIEVIKAIQYPQSIGLLYASITEYLGFVPNADEWKVMALASYGKGDNEFYKKFKKIVKLLPRGEFELNLSYFSGYNWDQPKLFTHKLEREFGPARQPEEELNARHYEIAAALQKITEEIVFHALEWLWKKTHLDYLVVSGGVFMNCVLNGKIVGNTPFKKVFVSSCPDDSGNSIGAALWVYYQLFKGKNRYPQVHNFYGPEFTDDQIKEILDRYKIPFIYVKEIEKEVALLLSKGKLVGWFQGKMEFGQRALGNRSILADPRSKEIKDEINKRVKFREYFRPFAPSILQEFAGEYFDIPEGERVPFMEKVYPVKKEKQALIPAVVHVDGTARLQTVDKQYNPRFYNLIREFYNLTRLPVVLNTSFNLAGEPIVCTPTDALRTFFSSGLDVLAMGNYLVFKDFKYTSKKNE